MVHSLDDELGGVFDELKGNKFTTKHCLVKARLGELVNYPPNFTEMSILSISDSDSLQGDPSHW